MMNYSDSMPTRALSFKAGGIICPMRHFDPQILE